MPSPLVQHLRRGVQIDHEAGIPQTLPVFERKHRAAPGCKHEFWLCSQFKENLTFAFAKATFALDFKYYRNAYAGPRLDFMVTVEEPALQAFGELAADGCLAGPHQADKIDIGAAGHAVILSAESKTGRHCRPFKSRENCQRSDNASAAIFGVINTSSSRRLSVVSFFLNR